MDLTPAFIVQNVLNFLVADFLRALLIVAIAVLLFIVFAIAVFVGAYLLAFLWAGYENDFRKGDEDEFVFNEETIYIVLVQQWTTFLLALDELLNLALAALETIINTLINNWISVVVFILAFALYVTWDSFHNILIPAFAQIYTCYISPLFRTLIVPTIDLAGFVAQSLLPLSNAARQIINSVTIGTILRVIVCGVTILQQIIVLLSLSFTQFLFAIVTWARTANTPTNAILDVGPNFIPATTTLGLALGHFDQVFTCACEPIGPIVIQPLFEPFRSSAFANATNATLALPFVFVSQGFARPLVRSFQNFNNGSGLPFIRTIYRPSLNSTFDTATRVLNQTGATFTAFTYALINVTINVAEVAVSACPPQTGWQRNGTCNSTSPAAHGFCNNTVCNVFAVKPGVPVNSSYANSIVDFACNKTLSCPAGSPPTRPCVCLDCLCTYAYINPFLGNATNLLAVGPCNSARNSTTCEANVPTIATVAPPTYDFWGGVLGLIDATFIQPFRYLFNILFQIDIVFTSLDGFLLFNYDYGIDRFNWAITAFFEDINWLGRFFIALGEQAAASDMTLIESSPAVMPMAFDSRKISPLSKQAVGLYSFARLQKAALQAGQTAQLGFNFIAQLLFFLGDVTLAFFIFLERLIFNEMYYVFFGTIYFTVRSGIEAQPRVRVDPLSYAKFRWGDNATSGIAYECGYIGNVGIGNAGQFTSVFRERVTNATAVTCTEQEEMLDFCRFVFQRVEAKNITSTNITDVGLAVVPSFIEITLGANGPYSDASVQTCLQRVTNCVPSIQFSVLQQVEIENAINDYNVTLQKGVDIFRALDPLIGVFCPNCTVIQNFISSFVEPLVPIILVLIDPFVHAEKFFTTAYLRCLDIEGALRAFNSFTVNITNIFRLINQRITGTPCLTGNNARDSRILCTLSQGLDSFVDVLVQLGIQAWRFIQLLLSIVTGAVPPSTVGNSITFEPVFADVENLAFDVLSVFAQVIPRSFNCTQTNVTLGNGCCFNQPISGVFNCRDNATQPDCINPNTTGFGPGSNWTLGVQCSVAHPLECQPKTVQATIAANVAQFIAAFINIWFRIVTNVVTAVVNTLASGDFLNVFGNVIAAVLRPIGQLASDFFLDLANIFECLGAADIASTFRQVAAVFALITTVGIKIFVTIVQFTVFFLAGLVQLLLTGETTLLQTAIGVLGDLFIFFLIAIFGDNFICGLQDAVCFITFGTVNFAIGACSSLNPPYPFQFCQTFVGLRPNGFQCLGDDITCVTGCPDFPLGCCGNLPFPPPGGDTTNFTASDSRFSCRPKMQQPQFFEPCFAPDLPLAGLKECYGQPLPDTNCPLFQNNSECVNVVLLDPNTGEIITRKRSVSNTQYTHPHHADNHYQRQHSEWTPSESFCGSFLAAYGFERARQESTRREPLHQDDKREDFKVAARCYQLAKLQSPPLEDQVHEALLKIIGSYLSPMIEKSRTLQAGAVDHWKSMAREAREHADHYRHTGEHHPTKRSLDRRIEEYHEREQVRPLAPFEIRGAHFIAEHGAAAQRQIIVGMMAALITWNHASERNELQQVSDKYRAAVRERDEITKYGVHAHKTTQQAYLDDANAPLTEMDKRYIGLRLIFYKARAHVGALMDGGGEYIKNFANLFGTYDAATKKFVRSVQIDRRALQAQQDAALQRFRETRLVNTYRLRFGESDKKTLADFRSGAKVSLLATTFQTQPISNDTLANLGLFECDPDTAVLCSNCYILDAGVNTVALAGNGIIQYFQNNVTGFGRQFQLFQFQINTTLFDPIGTDVYTTVNKTTPFIGARFFTIYGPLQWNYTEFKSILALGNGSAGIEDFDNLTDSIQILRSAQVGRPDQDIEIYNLFRVVLTPIVNALERVVNAIRNSTAFVVLQQLYATYIACDYQGALVCSSPRGIGLFNALVVAAVIYILLVAIATVAFPGTQVLLSRVLLIFFPYAVLWMAYGASPLCTVMSIFGGIRGIPACLPVDAAELINEVFPQCPYLPPSLIDPIDLAEASVTLCAECGTAPRMLSCATAVGFLNGFDVFFYLNAINGREALNQRIAEATNVILPDISALATLYTPAYAQSLGTAGMECAAILFGGIFIAGATLAFRAARVILFAGGVTFFVFGVILAAVAAIFAANFLLLQMEEGFVHGVFVRKLRLRPWSSDRKTELETLEKMD